MNYFFLKDIPSPPSDKTGWPWVKQEKSNADIMADNIPWPKISIITPSYNQGRYIEETIRSILLQGYPNLEYIIIDGGSTDNTIEIIGKYEKWISYWISETDKGQSHAINKGFARATGGIFAYINSDDFYEENAFFTIAREFLKDKKTQLIAGECVVFEGQSEKSIFRPWWPEDLGHFLQPFGSTFAQPASFWTRSVHEEISGFNENSHFCFDREFFLKIGLLGLKPLLIDVPIARYRVHDETKTSQTIRFYQESLPLIEKYAIPCGVSQSERKRLLKQTQNEINYLEVFITWKYEGRLHAMLRFISMFLQSPSFIFQRKILGQARRLLSFKAEEVVELSNV